MSTHVRSSFVQDMSMLSALDFQDINLLILQQIY